MNVTPEVAIIGISSVGALVIHATVFGVVAGKMMNRVAQVEKENKETKGGFITTEQCDGVNAIWEAKLAGMLEVSALRDVQNAKEHKILLSVATKTKESVQAVNILLAGIQQPKV